MMRGCLKRIDNLPNLNRVHRHLVSMFVFQSFLLVIIQFAQRAYNLVMNKSQSLLDCFADIYATLYVY